MASKYTCHIEGCDFVQELFWGDGDGIKAILDHEKNHKKYVREVEVKGKDDCKHCDGKGYIEYTYTIDQDVSEADRRRNQSNLY